MNQVGIQGSQLAMAPSRLVALLFFLPACAPEGFARKSIALSKQVRRAQPACTSSRHAASEFGRLDGITPERRPLSQSDWPCLDDGMQSFLCVHEFNHAIRENCRSVVTSYQRCIDSRRNYEGNALKVHERLMT